MIALVTFVLGFIFLIGGLVLLHYLKAILVGILLLVGGGIYWLFFDEAPRMYGRHYHD